MVHTLQARHVIHVANAVLQAMKTLGAAAIYVVGIFWIWFYTSAGFLFVNEMDNQTKVLLWSLIVTCSGFIAYGSALLIFRLMLGKKKREDASTSVFILMFWATALFFICAFLAYASTVFWMKDPAVMIACTTVSTAGAASVLWFSFRQMVKCWQGAKLP
jgi:hypothetical protein